MEKFNFKLFALFRGLPLIMYIMGLLAVNTFTDKTIHMKPITIIDVIILAVGIVIGLVGTLLIFLPISSHYKPSAKISTLKSIHAEIPATNMR